MNATVMAGLLPANIGCTAEALWRKLIKLNANDISIFKTILFSEIINRKFYCLMPIGLMIFIVYLN